MAQQTDISKMETTQTAVEWLEEKYHYLLVEADINDMHVVEFNKKRNELFEQAKAMHKEQILLSHINGQSEFDNGCYREENELLSEQYYNEKYPNGKKD
jgi:hypothetical protein